MLLIYSDHSLTSIPTEWFLFWIETSRRKVICFGDLHSFKDTQEELPGKEGGLVPLIVLGGSYWAGVKNGTFVQGEDQKGRQEAGRHWGLAHSPSSVGSPLLKLQWFGHRGTIPTTESNLTTPQVLSFTKDNWTKFHAEFIDTAFWTSNP